MLVEKVALVDNRYLLQEPVVRGGPIELYFALDRQLQRPVAVEILSERAASDEALCEKFHRHQRSVSTIHHSNILEIYDAGEWNGRPYLVMERDAGQFSSGDAAGTGVAIDPSAAIKMTRQAAEALHFCRQAGLVDWPFSYKAVRTGGSGNAHLALLEDSLLNQTNGLLVSRRDADDPEALSALLRLLLSGTPDGKDMGLYISTLPLSVAELLRRMQSGTPDSFANAGEVAEAIKEIEATSNDYTQANVAVPLAAPLVEQRIADAPTPPDLQRTSSLAEAPTLAVGQQSTMPPVAYVPTIEDTASNSTISFPAVIASSTTLDNTRPYIPGSNPVALMRGRRLAPFILLPLLGLLLLVVGTLFIAGQRGTNSPLRSDNLTALPTVTTPPVSLILPKVPDLLGKSLEEATTTVEELGIQLSEIDPVHSSYVPRDRVAVQDPVPGAELQPGTIIMVALSLGPAPKEADDDEEGAAPEAVESQPDQEQSPAKKDKGKK